VALWRALSHPVDVGAAALVERDGRIVLVRHSYRSGWYFPGGGVERGEAPAQAVLRELREEIGLTGASPPQLLGVYVRRQLWTINLIVLFRVADAVFEFKPSWEIRELVWADPAALPPGTGAAVARRLKELAGEAPQAPFW
jgi:8-oxo-dGTP pyrophosphatase MutT (NUDIX family)